MFICICNAVTEFQLLEAIKNGEQLPTGNRCCLEEVNEIIKRYSETDDEENEMDIKN